MGFNPTRKHRARRSDYLFVGAALVATVAAVVWALFA